MKIDFFGHACLKVYCGDGTAVLMDPWFTSEGAFFSSWFQFPENTPLLDDALQGVTDICISHNHADHLDPFVVHAAFARNRSLTLHIPHYQSDWFLKRIHYLLSGFEDRIVEHTPYEPFPTGKAGSVFFVPEESPAEIDSAIVCTVGGESLVNLNDARLNPNQLLRIRERVKTVDYLTLQASGASEYPINYTYCQSEMRQRGIEKRRSKFDFCKSVIDLIEPRRVLFFAGPPVLLDPSLRHFTLRTEESVFPDQLDILREIERDRPDIAEKAFFVLPGEELNETVLWPKTDLCSQRLFPYTEKETYVTGYAARRRRTCNFDRGELPREDLLLNYFNHMARISPYMSEQIGGEVTFIVKGRTVESAFTVDFPGGTARKGTASEALCILTAPAASVMAVLDGQATWDDIFLSFRMTFDERNGRFIPHLKVLLRYMDEGLFVALERYEKQLNRPNIDIPMIAVDFAGETLYIQRLCPHGGTDLERHGRVNSDGTITCLMHRLCFDLKTGECINAQGYRLRVK